MKTILYKVALTASFAVLLAGCEKEDTSDVSSASANAQRNGPNTTKTFYGPAVEIGEGNARTFITEDLNGHPITVGIRMTATALDNLPATGQQYVLYFPKPAGTDFYKHVLLDWNPQGHEPTGVYDVPHFDFHFYSISSSQREQIGPNDTIQFANAPAAQYQPPMYFQTPGGVPQMGAHWIDLLSPEFNGGAFTQTFIWGSYDGHFIFWEPMITRDYLLSHPNDNLVLRQPSAFQSDGWYAQNEIIRYSSSPNVYTIALDNLAFHAGQ